LPNNQVSDEAIEVKVKDFFRLSCNTYASSEVMKNWNLKNQPTTM